MKIHILILTICCNSILAMEHTLIQAIYNEDTEEIRLALSNHNPNFYDQEAHHTPLTLASSLGNEAIVNMLLDAGACTDYQELDETKKPIHPTALTKAARSGRVNICKLLLARGANIQPENPNDVSPLHAAACNGNLEIVQMLIARGAKLDAQNILGSTPLHQAIVSDVFGDHYRAFAYLLIAGANPDMQTWYTKEGRTYLDKTALMLAALADKELFVHALLLFNANADIPARNGIIPWKVTAFKANFEFVLN